MTTTSETRPDAAAVRAEIAAAVRGQTVIGEFLKTVSARGDLVALRWRAGSGWAEWTWRDYAERAARFGAGLQRLGLGRGQRVVIVTRNRPEFHVADLGTVLAGGTPVSLFGASSPEQAEYIVRHSGASVAVIEDAETLARFYHPGGALARLRHIVAIDAAGASEVAPAVVAFDHVLSAEPLDLAEASNRIRPEDLLTVVYTSGTSGPPKGVMIAHLNACWWIESVSRTLTSAEFSIPGKRQLSYLPMAAMAERLATHYLHLLRGTEVTTCAEADALMAHMQAVRPQIFLGVPRVWEKLHLGIQAALSADPARREGFQRALDVGRLAFAARAGGQELPAALDAAWRQAEAGALRPMRASLGLDACQVALSGTAPIPAEVVEFFLALGVPLTESYGLSESTAVTMDVWHPRPGTVGRPIPGCEIRMQDDGEILLRSGNLFQGYLDDAERTAEAIDGDGWFHTGDIGAWDADGYLRIVDRKKELIVTPDGRNVSPANLESAIKAACPLVGQACVIGDRRPYLLALLVLDPAVAAAWAREHGIQATGLAELSTDAAVRDAVGQALEQVNRRFAEPEQIRRFALLPEEWRPGTDEMTPTMKLRRHAIAKRREREIAEL